MTKSLPSTTEETGSDSLKNGDAPPIPTVSTKRSADLKLLLACKSCERDLQIGLHQVIRETWAKHKPITVPLRFFVGGNRAAWLKWDEVHLECPDDYQSLPIKTKAILRWTLEHHYDYVFLFDIDSFVVADKLLSSGFEDYDYYGLLGGNLEHGKFKPWASGCGYWLSRKAMQIVTHDIIVKDWAEDRMVGQILAPYIASGEIKAGHDVRYAGTDLPGECVGEIVCHFAAQGTRRMFDRRWMLDKYTAWKDQNGSS